MNDILLTAINARYSHASLGVRYLYANLGALQARACIHEFTLQDSSSEVVAAILAEAPRVVVMGVYIWNRGAVEQVVAALLAARPDLCILLGGPEIAHDTESPLARQVACVVAGEGEGEGVLEGLCRDALAGRVLPAVVKVQPLALSDIQLPYRYYSEDDLAHRTLYIETSRGCPYRCEYCISALDDRVRYFPLEKILPELDELLGRGARRFKFVDRSFNVNPRHACELLRFFGARWRDGMQLHFEMTPDGLSSELRECLLAFPPGALHIEAGVQTFNETVARRVSRNLDRGAVEEGLRFLIEDAQADVHADLIAGLPGETPAVFEAGFDRLLALQPSELQVGILKRLHGAPIARHIEEWKMTFRGTPPYDILSTDTMDAGYMAALHRFALHWDRVVNRHLLPTAAPYIWKDQPSAFAAFDQFSRVLEPLLGSHGFGLVDLMQQLLTFLTEQRDIPPCDARCVLRDDYTASGRRQGVPRFLRD